MIQANPNGETEEAYQAALDYLYSYINLEQKSLDRYHASKMDPDRPRRLLARLDNPQTRYPTLHVAGTKGKGSVAAMCASALRAAGLRVGLYTSPHLRDFRERIRILTPDDPRGYIPQQDFIAGLDAVRSLLDAFEGITWFEIVTAVAFAHFAVQSVDVAVIEVGLGGRLDATNIITPLVSIITSLSLDHTSLLGDTLGEIAFEKGGIIKSGVPVVCAPQQPEAVARLQAISAERGSPLEAVGQDWLYEGRTHYLRITRSLRPAYVPPLTEFELGLAGRHQVENGMVAVAALYHAQQRFPALTLPRIQQGLADVPWDGRLQIVSGDSGRPTLLVDSAHNQHSAAVLAAALRENYDYDRLWLLFGAPADKAIPDMMAELFPLADGVILSAADHPRAADPEDLAAQAAAQGFATVTAATPREALELAFDQAGPADLIVATGSIIFVGDLLNQWDRLQSPAQSS